MFDRMVFKKNARMQIHPNFGTALIITLIISAVSVILNIPSYVKPQGMLGLFYGMETVETSALYPFFLSIVSGIAGIIFTFASACYYVRVAQTLPNERTAFDVFLEGLNHWLLAIRSVLWMALWIILWAFVFYFPLFVKYYAYSQTLFILADNPAIGVRKALKMSMAMTRGYKWDLFILDLSFLGWVFLSVCTFGLLFLWVTPYYNTTHANAYCYLKQAALKDGKLTEANFTVGEDRFQNERYSDNAHTDKY